jgi:hypothetical protein
MDGKVSTSMEGDEYFCFLGGQSTTVFWGAMIGQTSSTVTNYDEKQ